MGVLIDKNTRTTHGHRLAVSPVRAQPQRAIGHWVHRLAGLFFVFFIALCWFSLGVADSGVGSAYCDPVSRIQAQDESVYLRESIEMVQSGKWATPNYLGRYALNKPPLEQWLAAASMTVFGISAWAARIPSMLAAALILALVFAWTRRAHSSAVAVGAVLLLASSHLFYVFARLSVTDMLLVAWITLAVFILWRDPALERMGAAVGFGACCGAAVMTKAAAGVLPLIALAIAAALLPRNSRPRLKRVAVVLAAGAAVAAPWHIYEALTHPRWFWAEYVLTQHLAIGVIAPPQYTNENHFLFYARRLFLMDPVLSLAAAAGVVVTVRQWRRRTVTLAWLGAVLAGLIVFRYRSAYYLLPLLPVLAVCAAGALCALPRSAQGLTVALLLVVAGLKTASASPASGLPALRASELPAAAALERYCGKARGNDLIVVGSADQFYASDLPLAGLRYCLAPPPRRASPRPAPLDFNHLGISVTVDEFNDLARLRPKFRARLAAFNLPSDAAAGTVIWARDAADVSRLIEAHPESDFMIPRSLLWHLGPAGAHRVVPADAERVFLLSPDPMRHTAGWACGL